MSLWVCRFCVTLFVYMYHSWEGVFMLIWVIHSFVILRDQKWFARMTLWFYLPIFICIVIFIFLVNILYLFPDRFIDQAHIGEYGVIQFEVPTLECGFCIFTIFTLFYWIKQTNELTHEEDQVYKQGQRIAQSLSREESRTFSKLFLLSMPLI